MLLSISLYACSSSIGLGHTQLSRGLLKLTGCLLSHVALIEEPLLSLLLLPLEELAVPAFQHLTRMPAIVLLGTNLSLFYPSVGNQSVYPCS